MRPGSVRQPTDHDAMTAPDLETLVNDLALKDETCNYTQPQFL
jgi:hypothetical protein